MHALPKDSWPEGFDSRGCITCQNHTCENSSRDILFKDFEVLEFSTRTFDNDNIVVPYSASHSLLHTDFRLHVFSLAKIVRNLESFLISHFIIGAEDQKEDRLH